MAPHDRGPPPHPANISFNLTRPAIAVLGPVLDDHFARASSGGQQVEPAGLKFAHLARLFGGGGGSFVQTLLE